MDSHHAFYDSHVISLKGHHFQGSLFKEEMCKLVKVMTKKFDNRIGAKIMHTNSDKITSHRCPCNPVGQFLKKKEDEEEDEEFQNQISNWTLTVL